jgi:predicted AlkP superfamily phosphohydrolase/phosphomutase
LTGKAPARFGFFDTLLPLSRLSRPSGGKSGYTVVEEHTGRDATPPFFTELLRSAGYAAQFEEVSSDELVASVRALAGEQDVIKLIKVSLSASDADKQALRDALRLAQAWVGDKGLLALLSDAQPAPVKRFVNINNFLADMGIIERDEQSGEISWENSLAYFVGHGQLWINLLGRDPQGAVHPQEEYNEVRETLIQALPAKLRDAETGEQVIERVLRKEDLYSDEYLFCAPDLVVVFKPGYAPSEQSSRLAFDKETFTTPAAGTTAIAGMNPEQIQGYLLVAGPAFVSGESSVEAAPLTSVAPTLLHALGVAPVDMESSATQSLFAFSFLEKHPIQSGEQSQELSEEDEELVINRLRDLGYI